MNKFVKLLTLMSFLIALTLAGIKHGRVLDVSPKEKIVKANIPAGATFSKLAAQLGIATGTAEAILVASAEKYDLSKIVEGRQLALVFSTTKEAQAGGDHLKKLIYQINTEEELTVEKSSDQSWQAAVSHIEYAIEHEAISSLIQSSLYGAFMENNWDTRLALSLAEMFAWQIDFAADIQQNDNFKVFYEKRFLNGEYMMPGKILAAEFTNSGKVFRGYYFASANTKEGYYDDEGNSLQKVFLKAPLQYKYISSGFSYARVNPITKKVSPHRGIDYAAPAGTPAVSVGDGTVIQAGWNGYYGISVTVRHNDTFRTIYGHFSSLAKGIRVGAKVKQGQVVGYVGSTGQATGPHLHYEMHKFGSHINPFLVEIPPGEPIAETDRPLFESIKAEFNNSLK